MFCQNVPNTSLRQEALWAAKELINGKSLSYSFKQEKWQNVCSFTHSNQCSSHVAKGAAPMTSGPFCHEHGGGRFKKLGLAYPHTQLMRNEVRSDKNLERDRPTDRRGSPPAHVTSASRASACQGSFPPQLPGDPLSFFYWSQNDLPKQTWGQCLAETYSNPTKNRNDMRCKLFPNVRF